MLSNFGMTTKGSRMTLPKMDPYGGEGEPSMQLQQPPPEETHLMQSYPHMQSPETPKEDYLMNKMDFAPNLNIAPQQKMQVQGGGVQNFNPMEGKKQGSLLDVAMKILPFFGI